MNLAQVPIQNDPIGTTVNDSNYSFIQNTLRPSYFLRSTINLMLGAAGVFSFIFLLWGGLQWITAGGDKDAVEKARKKILGALIGLAIVFSSYTALFVLRTWFNVNLIEFQIRQLGDNWTGGGGGPPPPGPTLPPGVTPTSPPGCGPCSCTGGGHANIGQIGPVGFGGTCYTCQSSGWSTPTYPAMTPPCQAFITCTCP
jgi:hypothetical protein